MSIVGKDRHLPGQVIKNTLNPMQKTSISVQERGHSSSTFDSCSTKVVQKWSQDLADMFDEVDTVAIDVEAVDLGREGRISLVQMSTPGSKGCLILDLLDKSTGDPLVVWLRSILESDKIIKVIHDCRMDSDALKLGYRAFKRARHIMLAR